METEANESPVGYTWRLSHHFGMDLGSFCSLSLNLTYGQKYGDLDSLLVGEAASSLAAISGVSESMVRSLALPREAMQSVWDSSTKAYSGQVFVCPECLSSPSPIVKKSWRTVLGAACPDHQRYLVGNCAECGESLRYQARYGGQNYGHWLDFWPRCLACGADIEPGAMAPQAIVNFAQEWEKRLGEGDSSTMSIDDEWKLAMKLWRHCRKAPGIVHSLANCVGLSARVNGLAVASAAIFSAFTSERYMGISAEGEMFRKVLFGLPVNEVAFAEVLAGDVLGLNLTAGGLKNR